MTVDALSPRPLHPSEAQAFNDADAIEAAVILSHFHLERIDLIYLLVDDRVHGLRFDPEDGWTAEKLGREDDPENFKRVMGAVLSRRGYTVRPGEDGSP